MAAGRSSGADLSAPALEMRGRAPAANAAVEKKTVLVRTDGRTAAKRAVDAASASSRIGSRCVAFVSARRRNAAFPATYAAAATASSTPVSRGEAPYDSTKSAPE